MITNLYLNSSGSSSPAAIRAILKHNIKEIEHIYHTENTFTIITLRNGVFVFDKTPKEAVLIYSTKDKQKPIELDSLLIEILIENATNSFLEHLFFSVSNKLLNFIEDSDDHVTQKDILMEHHRITNLIVGYLAPEYQIKYIENYTLPAWDLINYFIKDKV